MRLGTLLAMSLLMLCSAAHADILHLEGGGRVEGVVTAEGGIYVVRSVRGTARLPRSDVVKRVSLPYVTEVYEERRNGLMPEDAEGRYRLALWCSTHGLARRAKIHLEEVLLISPDHARARARLGFVSFKGVWMRPEEARSAEMAARGYLQFEGRWFTPAGLKAWIDAQGDLALLEEEIARKRVERAKAELEARRVAEKLAKEEAERKALEAALARVEADRRERERLARQNEEMLRLLRDLYLRNSLYGYSSYGYSTRGLGACRQSLPTYRVSRPQLSFRWSRGNLHVRGRIR